VKKMLKDRYSRQELFRPIGKEGQQSINRKHVLLIGAGALGAGNAEALVRAGIGKLTIVDRDYVEASNLQRQQLYSEEDARRRLPKAIAAKNRLEKLNSSVSIKVEIMDATHVELLALAASADLIIDATDNSETRFVINDVAHKLSIPWIYGACVGSYGMTFTVLPGVTPCFNCLWSNIPMTAGQTCDTAGIISSAVNMVVSYQTTECLKILVKDFHSLSGRLITFDLWKNTHSAIKVDKIKKDDCPTCGKAPLYPYLSRANMMKAAVLCGRDTVQIRTSSKKTVNLDDLHTIFTEQGFPVQYNPYLLSVTFNPHRMVIFQDGRVLIHGTNNIAEAKKTYHRVFS
jgi:molybdopterin/thiamine biosynthesis adenylyltransferase